MNDMKLRVWNHREVYNTSVQGLKLSTYLHILLKKYSEDKQTSSNFRSKIHSFRNS